MKCEPIKLPWWYGVGGVENYIPMFYISQFYSCISDVVDGDYLFAREQLWAEEQGLSNQANLIK